MSKSVAHIFGGETKVKMMRLFIFNPAQAYEISDVVSRTKESPRQVRRELSALIKSGLVRQRGAGKSKGKGAKKKRGAVARAQVRKTPLFTLNGDYPYLAPLADFLIDAAPISEKEIMKKLSRTGTSVKLILLAGVFTHDSESRVDLLIVGDHLKKGSLVTAISQIEAELGKEIRYAAFETGDFRYRLSMYDKLIRDILDFPHQKILNKIGLAEQKQKNFLSTPPSIGEN
ncbi:MAG: seg [Parcubacteria group bacterium]|nr:seg [Parcubacteria group bacterium]